MVVLPELHAADKVAALASSWAQDEMGRLSLTLALEIYGATVQGLYLRGKARRDLADRAVMFQLEYRLPFQLEEQICRIDWRPLHVHRNDGKGPEAYRFKEINGSHYHTFAENWLPIEGRMRRNNLPIAIPLDPEPSGFGQLLALVSKEFRISNLGGVQIPPWDLML